MASPTSDSSARAPCGHGVFHVRFLCSCVGDAHASLGGVGFQALRCPFFAPTRRASGPSRGVD
eukprot:11158195-Lingulodinium_polyedra.AAC.1